MLTSDMKRIIEQRLGFVATATCDGVPNVSPTGTFVVLDDETIAFGEIRSPGTMRNLKTNPLVEVNFVDPFVRKGYRFAGTANAVEAQMSSSNGRDHERGGPPRPAHGIAQGSEDRTTSRSEGESQGGGARELNPSRPFPVHSPAICTARSGGGRSWL
jgi:Pyridoxamine 5'-phosphate oxidase